MTKLIKLLTVVGARPQFVKAATISRVLKDLPGVVEVMVHTGQHFDKNMSEVFFSELDIPHPQHSLGIHGLAHGAMTGRMLEALEQILVDEQPDCVLIYGDTNSTLAGALASTKLHIPVAHVEAGLRSYNRRMPEEVNRVLTDHVSSFLFCPTAVAVANLTKEGIVNGVHSVGDVMYDATLAATRLAYKSMIINRLGLRAGGYDVATVHRAENTDDPDRLAEIFNFLCTKAKEVPVVLPLHPRSRTALEQHKIPIGSVQLCEPLSYLDMTRLVSECREVITDSGGLQKEAYFHRKPCITLREETEWVETIECGWNRLWRGKAYTARQDILDYGDGKAANRIVDVLLAAIMDQKTAQ